MTKMPKISLDTAKELVPVLMQNVLTVLKNARLHVPETTVLVNSEECKIKYISVYDYDVPKAKIEITMDYNGEDFRQDLIKFIDREYVIQNELVYNLLNKLYYVFKVYIEFYKRVVMAYRSAYTHDGFKSKVFHVETAYFRADRWACKLITTDGIFEYRDCDDLYLFNLPEYV